MGTIFNEVSEARQHLRRLLGGWRDVKDDVGRLVAGLKVAPNRCPCADGASHLGGTCPCCRAQARRLDEGCADCNALILALGLKIDTLVGDSLRFLPAVADMIGWDGAAGAPRDRPDRRSLDAVQRAILGLERTFSRLETASAEFKRGCGASHLEALKSLAQQLLSRVDEIDDVLDPTPGRQPRGAISRDADRA